MNPLNKSKHYSLLRVATLGLLVLSYAEFVPAQVLPENPVPKILQDWEKRGRAASAVEYVISGTKAWPRDGASSSAMVTGALSATLTLDFNRNRCRLESIIPQYFSGRRQLYEFRAIHVGGDGKTMVRIFENTNSLWRPTEAVDFMIIKGSPDMILSERLADACFWPIFYASGVVPTAQHPIKTSNINPGLTPEAFVFEGYETNQGRSLAKLRVDYVQRYRQTNWFFVDLERDSAIVKTITQTGMATNGPLTIREIDYDLMNGFWVPSQWRAMWYGMGGDLHEIETIIVNSSRRPAHVSDNLFELAPTLGMKVLEIDNQLDPVTQQLVVQERRYQLGATGAAEHNTTTMTSLDIGRVGNKKPAQRPVVRFVLLGASILFAIWIGWRWLWPGNSCNSTKY
jgi:hypothetical protein